MSTNAQPARSTKTFRIKLEPLPIDERLAFVDRACILMSDGRFGECRMSRLFMGEPHRHNIDGAVLVGVSDHRWLSSDWCANEPHLFAHAIDLGLGSKTKLHVLIIGERVPKMTG
jgi:hypothetical protein